jgi:hypothetical protein
MGCETGRNGNGMTGACTARDVLEAEGDCTCACAARGQRAGDNDGPEACAGGVMICETGRMSNGVTGACTVCPVVADGDRSCACAARGRGADGDDGPEACAGGVMICETGRMSNGVTGACTASDISPVVLPIKPHFR